LTWALHPVEGRQVASYRGTADRGERAGALAAVAAVHVALAFIILTGLSVPTFRHAAERITTIVIESAPPAVQPPPKPIPKRESAKRPEGAAAKRADPTPVVAPEAKLPVPTPIPAAKVAGTGAQSNSGAAASGTGSGAGGQGMGAGGGGDTSGYTPARRISKIPDSEYRALSRTGIRSGSVGVTIKVDTDGTVSNCRVARSSGDPSIDGLMCRLTLQYVRFDPARDNLGRPVAQDITFFPNWYRP
jgi:protein TonB